MINRPTVGPILPARTANQYLANMASIRSYGKIFVRGSRRENWFTGVTRVTCASPPPSDTPETHTGPDHESAPASVRASLSPPRLSRTRAPSLVSADGAKRCHEAQGHRLQVMSKHLARLRAWHRESATKSLDS